MAISRRLRFEILRRDNYTCRYCGSSAPGVQLTVDHVNPVTLGGKDDPTNLVTACTGCNAGKASIGPDSPIVADVEKDALRWARAIQEVLKTDRMDRQVMDGLIREFDALWLDWTYGPEGDKEYIPRRGDWQDSVERFINAGLDLDTLAHFVGVAMRNNKIKPRDTWAYFCGCCWRRLDDIHERAVKVITFDEKQQAGNI